MKKSFKNIWKIKWINSIYLFFIFFNRNLQCYILFWTANVCNRCSHFGSIFNSSVYLISSCETSCYPYYSNYSYANVRLIDFTRLLVISSPLLVQKITHIIPLVTPWTAKFGFSLLLLGTHNKSILFVRTPICALLGMLNR